MPLRQRYPLLSAGALLLVSAAFPYSHYASPADCRRLPSSDLIKLTASELAGGVATKGGVKRQSRDCCQGRRNSSEDRNGIRVRCQFSVVN